MSLETATPVPRPRASASRLLGCRPEGQRRGRVGASAACRGAAIALVLGLVPSTAMPDGTTSSMRITFYTFAKGPRPLGPEGSRYAAPVIAIVGAGAAGLATAIFAGRRGVSGPVVLFDGAARPGAKILVSGGSRCNVTNAVVTEADFYGAPPHLVRRVLRALGVAETVAFFREIGVALHEEEHGKLFPDANRSRVVLQALLDEAARRGVVLRAGERVVAVSAAAGGFVVRTTREELAAARVVLATGGLSLPKTGSDGHGLRMAEALGHSVVPTTPALVPLVLDGSFHARLSGVAHEVEMAVRADGPRDRAARGLAALDALRRERPGGARRLARLAARTPRRTRAGGRGEPAARPRLRGRRGGARAALGGEPAPQRGARPLALAARGRGGGGGPRGGPRRDDARPAAPRRAPRARAPARRPRPAGGGQPRLRLRGGDGGRRAALRGGHAHDGVAPAAWALPGRGDARRGRPHRRLQLPVGVVERLGGGGRARGGL